MINIKALVFIYFITIVGLTVNGKKKNDLIKIKNCKQYALRRNISTSFDTLILTVSWPAVICYKHLKTTHEKTPCKFPPNNQWSIHGLWPSRIARRAPDFCNCSRKYNPAEVASLMPELEQKWVDIKNCQNKSLFWEHEWSKHGTCASSVEALNTQFKYFNQTLKLFDKYNVTTMLRNAKIKLEGTYKQADILNAFEKQLGKQIGINCLAELKHKKYFLASIHFCFDKAFNLIDCVKNNHYPQNCPSSQKKSVEIEYSSMEEMIEEFY